MTTDRFHKGMIVLLVLVFTIAIVELMIFVVADKDKEPTLGVNDTLLSHQEALEIKKTAENMIDLVPFDSCEVLGYETFNDTYCIYNPNTFNPPYNKEKSKATAAKVKESKKLKTKEGLTTAIEAIDLNKITEVKGTLDKSYLEVKTFINQTAYREYKIEEIVYFEKTALINEEKRHGREFKDCESLELKEYDKDTCYAVMNVSHHEPYNISVEAWIPISDFTKTKSKGVDKSVFSVGKADINKDKKDLSKVSDSLLSKNTKDGSLDIRFCGTYAPDRTNNHTTVSIDHILETEANLVFLYSDVNPTHACSYYKATFTGNTVKKIYSQFAWWNASWQYKELITINSSTAMTNTPVNFTINLTSKIAAGKVLANCADIRILNASEDAEYSFFIENCESDGSNSNIWIKMPNIDTATSVYLYYGNSSYNAVSASSGASTFYIYDDFSATYINTTLWLNGSMGTGTAQIASGKMVLNPQNAYSGRSYIKSIVQNITTIGYAIEASFNVTSGSADFYYSYMGFLGSNNSVGTTNPWDVPSMVRDAVFLRMNTPVTCGQALNDISIFQEYADASTESVKGICEAPNAMVAFNTYNYYSLFWNSTGGRNTTAITSAVGWSIQSAAILTMSGYNWNIFLLQGNYVDYSGTDMLIDWVRVRKMPTGTVTFTEGAEEMSAPTISITFPTNASVVGSAALNITGTCSGENLDTVITNNTAVMGTNQGTDANWWFYNTTMTEKAWDFNITCNSTTNVRSSNMVYFTINTTKTQIAFLDPTPNNLERTEFKLNNETIKVSATLSVSTCILNWDGVNESMTQDGVNWTKEKRGLTGANHTFSVYCNATNGFWNMSETRWVIPKPYFNYTFLDVQLPYEEGNWMTAIDTCDMPSGEDFWVVVQYNTLNGTAPFLFAFNKTAQMWNFSSEVYRFSDVRCMDINKTGHPIVILGYKYDGTVTLNRIIEFYAENGTQILNFTLDTSPLVHGIDVPALMGDNTNQIGISTCTGTHLTYTYNGTIIRTVGSPGASTDGAIKWGTMLADVNDSIYCKHTGMCYLEYANDTNYWSLNISQIASSSSQVWLHNIYGDSRKEIITGQLYGNVSAWDVYTKAMLWSFTGLTPSYYGTGFLRVFNHTETQPYVYIGDNGNLSSAILNATNGEPVWEDMTGNVTSATFEGDFNNDGRLWGIGIHTSQSMSSNFTLIQYAADDVLSPVVTITSPVNNTNSTDFALPVGWSYTEANPDICWWNDDGVTNTTVVCGDNLTGSWVEGMNHVTIWMNDTSGNEGYDDVYFTIDTTPPHFINPPESSSCAYDECPALLEYFDAEGNDDFDSYAINWTTGFTINSTGYLSNTSRIGAGTYTINITINDTLGNINSTIYTYTVYKSNGLIRAYVNNTETDFMATGEQSNIYLNGTLITGTGTINLYLDEILINTGASPLHNISTLVIGEYYLNATYAGNDNYSADYEYWFINISEGPDTTKPIITFSANSTAAGTHPQNYIYFCGDLVESHPDTVGYSWNSVNSTTWTSGYCKNQTSLADGTYTVYLWANDTAGNYNQSETRTITLDTTKPQIYLYSPLNTSYTTTTLPLTYGTSETMNWIGYSIDASPNTTLSGNTTIGPALLQGTNTIILCGNDTAGNMNCTTLRYFSIDSIDPTIIGTAPTGSYNDTSAIPISYTANDTNRDSCWYNYNGTNTPLPSCANTTIAVTTNGTYTMTIYVNDTFGNTASYSDTFTAGYTSPPTPNTPSLSYLPVSPMVGDILRINATTIPNKNITVVESSNLYGTNTYTLPSFTDRTYINYSLRVDICDDCVDVIKAYNWSSSAYVTLYTSTSQPSPYVYYINFSSPDFVNVTGLIKILQTGDFITGTRILDNLTAYYYDMNMNDMDYYNKIEYINGTLLRDWNTTANYTVVPGLDGHTLNISVRSYYGGMYSAINSTTVTIANITSSEPLNNEIIIGNPANFTFNLTSQDILHCYQVIDNTTYDLGNLTDGNHSYSYTVPYINTTVAYHSYHAYCTSWDNTSLTINTTAINFTNYFANWTISLYTEDDWNTLFDTNGTNATLYVFCENRDTYIYNFTNSTTGYLTMECDVSSLAVILDYPTDSYLREIAVPDDREGEVRVYMADAFIYTILQIPIKMMDYKHADATIRLYKKSNYTEYTVTSGRFDAESKFVAYLKKNNKYFMQIIDGDTIYELTYLYASSTDTQYINVEDLSLTSHLTTIGGSIHMGGYFLDDNTTLRLAYNDTLDLTDNVTITIYDANNNIIWNATYNGTDDLVVDVPGLNSTNRYSVKFNANHGLLGNSPIEWVMAVGGSFMNLGGIPGYIYLACVLAMVLFTAAVIVPKNKLFGLIFIAAELGVFGWYMGWMQMADGSPIGPYSTGLMILILALGIIHEFRKGSGES